MTEEEWYPEIQYLGRGTHSRSIRWAEVIDGTPGAQPDSPQLGPVSEHDDRFDWAELQIFDDLSVDDDPPNLRSSLGTEANNGLGIDYTEYPADLPPAPAPPVRELNDDSFEDEAYPVFSPWTTPAEQLSRSISSPSPTVLTDIQPLSTRQDSARLLGPPSVFENGEVPLTSEGYPYVDYLHALHHINSILDSILELCLSESHRGEEGLLSVQQSLPPQYCVEWASFDDHDIPNAIALHDNLHVQVHSLTGSWRLQITSYDLITSFRRGFSRDIVPIDSLEKSSASSYLVLLEHALHSQAWPTRTKRGIIKLMNKIVSEYNVIPPALRVPNITLLEEHPIAAGGFADIYKGTIGPRIVCLKVLRYSYARNDATNIRRKVFQDFANEALVWRQLVHPNVLPFIGVTDTRFPGRLCFVSPFMDNGDLMTFLRNHPNHDRLTSLYEVSKGVNYLHGIGITHGDVKGANILVNDSLQCQLTDFGIATMVALHSSTGDLVDTSNNGIRGSLRWMAPEHISPTDYPRPTRPTSRDIYALGCTMLEVMTGKPPLSGIKQDVTIIIHIVVYKKTPPRPHFVHDDLWELMNRCWAHNAEDRPVCADVMDALHALCSSESGLEGGVSVAFQELDVDDPDSDAWSNVADLGTSSSRYNRSEFDPETVTNTLLNSLSGHLDLGPVQSELTSLRGIHPLLDFQQAPAINYDFTRSPESATVSSEDQLEDLKLCGAATFPLQFRSLTIYHPALQWGVKISFVNVYGNIVNHTVFDILSVIHNFLRFQASASDYKELSPGRQIAVSAAFNSRCEAIQGRQAMEEEKNMGLRRVDFLEGAVMFLGLEHSLTVPHPDGEMVLILRTF